MLLVRLSQVTDWEEGGRTSSHAAARIFSKEAVEGPWQVLIARREVRGAVKLLCMPHSLTLGLTLVDVVVARNRLQKFLRRPQCDGTTSTTPAKPLWWQMCLSLTPSFMSAPTAPGPTHQHAGYTGRRLG